MILVVCMQKEAVSTVSHSDRLDPAACEDAVSHGDPQTTDVDHVTQDFDYRDSSSFQTVLNTGRAFTVLLSVTMIYVDGHCCHLVLLHAYIFVFCLLSRIPSTLSTSKTVIDYNSLATSCSFASAVYSYFASAVLG